MRHASLAAGHPIGFKQPHLRPAQAKAISDGVINFRCCSNAVIDQPQGFAPHSFEETIGNKRRDFGADMKRVHAKLPKHLAGLVNRRLAGFCAAD